MNNISILSWLRTLPSKEGMAHVQSLVKTGNAANINNDAGIAELNFFVESGVVCLTTYQYQDYCELQYIA